MEESDQKMINLTETSPTATQKRKASGSISPTHKGQQDLSSDLSELNQADENSKSSITTEEEQQPQQQVPSRTQKKQKLKHGDDDQNEEDQNQKVKSNLKPTINEKSIVEIDLNKFNVTIKQKPIELCEVSNSVKKELVGVTELLESSKVEILEFDQSQLNLIGTLVHESDKNLNELIGYVRSKLLPQSELEDDEIKKQFDPIPVKTIKKAINSVAKRFNYFPDQTDLDWLPLDLPKNFQIWKWEVNDRSSVVPVELKALFERRWEERQLIKPQICNVLCNLSSSERDSLLKKLQSSGKRRSNNKTSTISASQEKTLSSKITPSSSQNIPDSDPSTPLINSNSNNSSLSKVDNQNRGSTTTPTMKELAKLQRDQKRKEKEEIKIAEEQQKKKMTNMLSGWISKANSNQNSQSKPTNTNISNSTSSPQNLSNLNSNSTEIGKSSNDLSGLDKSLNSEGLLIVEPNNNDKNKKKKGLMNDFERSFKPFNLKANSELAPINRFRSSSDNCSNNNNKFDNCKDENSTLINLTTQECLAEYLRSNKSTSNSDRKVGLISVREIVNRIAESELSGSIEGVRRWRRKLQNRSLVPLKLIRFHDDVRPGYVGTWSKTSRLVNGRNPYGKDTCLLNYEYDSEADWVEEDGEGEDLEGSDGHEEENESMNSEDSDDGWLVGDDEIEVEEDGLENSNNLDRNIGSELDPISNFNHSRNNFKKLKKINNGQNSSNLKRSKIVGPLIPVIKGPFWEKRLGIQTNLPNFDSFKIQFINSAPIGLNPISYVSEVPNLRMKDSNQIITMTNEKGMNVKNRLNLNNSLKSTKALIPLPLNQQSSPPDPKSSSTKNFSSKSDQIRSNMTKTNSAKDPMTKTVMTNTTTKVMTSSNNSSGFPNELVPRLLNLVNGNKRSKPLLVEDLRIEFLDYNLSKRSIERKLAEVAVKVGGVWRVVEQVN